jgi:DNA-3-methyladenine glycosylase II
MPPLLAPDDRATQTQALALAGTEAIGTVTVVEPFSLAQAASVLRGFPPSGIATRCGGDEIRAPFLLHGRAVLVHVRQPRPGAVSWVARTDGPPPDPAAVAELLRAWLSLDDPVAEFYQLIGADPELRLAVAALHGLHQVRFASLAEGLTWLTITHRVTQAQALEWKQRIAQRYGHPVRAGGPPMHAFPSLDALLAIPQTELLSLLHTSYRVNRLRSVLNGVCDLGEERLRTLPFEQAHAELLAIPGIGPRTGEAVLFRVLGRRGPLGTSAPHTVRRHYGAWIGYRAYYLRAALARTGGRPR